MLVAGDGLGLMFCNSSTHTCCVEAKGNMYSTYKAVCLNASGIDSLYCF